MPKPSFTSAEKAVVVRRRMYWTESMKDFTAWVRQQGGALAKATDNSCRKFIDEHKRDHPARREIKFWEGIEDKIEGDLNLWDNLQANNNSYDGFRSEAVSISPQEQVVNENRRRIVLHDAFRRMMACGGGSDIQLNHFDLDLAVDGLNLVWPVSLIPGGEAITVDEYVWIVNHYPDLKNIVPRFDKNTQKPTTYKWITNTVLQARVVEQRAKRCEDLAKLANTNLPRHLILFILPRFSMHKKHYAWSHEDVRVVNPFFTYNPKDPNPFLPETHEIDSLIDAYLGDGGYGHSTASLARAFRLAAFAARGVRPVLEYLVGRRWPSIMFPSMTVEDWLEDDNSRYAKVNPIAMDEYVQEAERNQAEILAIVNDMTDEEQQTWKMGKARECLDVWLRLEEATRADFLDYRYLQLQQNARQANVWLITHPHIQAFMSAFGVRTGVIASSDIHQSPPHKSYEWIHHWIHFICNPALDFSLASNGPRGIDFMKRSSLRTLLTDAADTLLNSEGPTFDRLGIPAPTDYLELLGVLADPDNTDITNRIYWIYVNLLKTKPHVMCTLGEFNQHGLTGLQSITQQEPRAELGYHQWEIDLIQRYWKEEGTLYGLEWTLGPILNRSPRSIRYLIKSHSHMFAPGYRRVRDWTKAYGEE
ncbi:hypothetical protein IAU59_000672 [Kwoniella sp. CBS 9459]